MHELLRQYAGEKLEQSPDVNEAVGDRHCAYYIGLLEAWEPCLKESRQPALLREIDLDIANARAAWDWAVGRAQTDRLGHAVEGLCYYYMNCGGRYRECEAACRAAANRLKAAAYADGSDAGKAEGLRVLVRILRWQSESNGYLGNTEVAVQLALQGLALLDRTELTSLDTRRERAPILQGLALLSAASERSNRLRQQALSLWRALGDQHGIAEALYQGGATSLRYGDSENAEVLLRESVAICQRFGYRSLAANGLRDLAEALHWSGQFDRARSLLAERLTNYDELGDVPGSAHRYWLLSLAHMHLGNYQRAYAEGELGLALSRQIDSRHMIGSSLALLACVTLADAEHHLGAAIPPGMAEGGEVRKRDADALRMAQESVDVSKEVEAWQRSVITALSALGLAARRLGRPDQAKQHLYESLQGSSEIWAFQWSLLPLSAAAILLADVGEHERAVELYALASRYPYVANSRWFEDVFGRHIDAVAATLPTEVAEAARERGCARDLQETVKELLAELEAWPSQVWKQVRRR